MTSTKKISNALPIAALIFAQLIFGLNFAATRIILVDYPPLLWGAVRLLIAAILMFACAFVIVPVEQRRTDWNFLWHCCLYGIIGIAANQAFFMLGLKHTTTTNAAILSTLTPIFTLLFGVIKGVEKLTIQKTIGFLLAVTGAIVIRKFEDFQMGSETFKGDLFMIINCALLALFFILSGKFLKANSPFWATAWMFLFGSVFLFAFSFQDIDHIVPIHTSTSLYFAMFYNIFFATMVTYFLNSWTLTKVKPSAVSVFFYFQPAIAVLNAWLTGGENPSTRAMVAMGLIFSGVAVGVIKKT